jgi:hypothetical protein
MPEAAGETAPRNSPVQAYCGQRRQHIVIGGMRWNAIRLVDGGGEMYGMRTREANAILTEAERCEGAYLYHYSPAQTKLKLPYVSGPAG